MTGPRIGYLVKAFPVVSETFILNEIRAMERHGVPVAILALKPAPETPIHEAVRSLESRLSTAPWERPSAWPGLILDHLRLLTADFSSYRRSLGHELGRFLGPCLRRPDAAHRLLVRKRLRRFAWAGWVAREAQRSGVRHIHAHYAGEPLRVAHLVYRLTGIPYSFTAHAKDLYLAPGSRLRRRIASARFATSCHRQGTETLRRIAARQDRSKVLLVRHGLDLDLFAPGARPGPGGASSTTTRPRILAVGRLTEKKGFDDLVTACGLLRDGGLDFECDVVGDGKLRPLLAARIEELGLGNRVRLRGFVPQEELPAWYRSATLLAAPSKDLADGNRDGVPNVVLEAMASGLPIVTTTAGSIPEVIRDGENGRLVPPGNAAQLAAAIAGSIADPAGAERLGRAAAADVGELDFVRANAPLAERFTNILNERLDRALESVATGAWEGRGLARKARKRLGLKPRRRAAVEASIAAAVRPGLRANAWRPDLERLAGRRLWDEVVKAPRLPALLPLLLGGGLRGESRILDLGSGRGGLSVALRARGFDATALDLRYRNCAVARWRGRRYGLEVPALSSIAEALPFADGSFDSVACLEVLEHVTDPVAVLNEVRRVLKPGGRCVVTVINRWAHLDPHYHLWGINFLPRRWAARYISRRRRTKTSYRDRQTLDEMHYYSFRGFNRLAESLGFAVEDPSRPLTLWRKLLHGLSRALSLGFNSVTLVLETPANSAAVAAHQGDYQDERADENQSQRPVIERQTPHSVGLIEGR